MVRCIVRDILPKYLVYRSVIQAVNGTMGNLDQPPHRKRVIASVEKDVWLNFPRLSLERLVVTLQATALKGKGATCDNVKVQLMLFYRYFLLTFFCSVRKSTRKIIVESAVHVQHSFTAPKSARLPHGKRVATKRCAS
jgi:hypothetical protein